MAGLILYVYEVPYGHFKTLVSCHLDAYVVWRKGLWSLGKCLGLLLSLFVLFRARKDLQSFRFARGKNQLIFFTTLRLSFFFKKKHEIFYFLL